MSIKTYLFIELKLLYSIILFSGIHYQFSSVIRSCLTLCYPMDCSTQGFPVHHQLPELAQTDVHQAGDSIQPSPELWPDRLLCPWKSPGQNTGVGSHSLLQGIIPSPGIKFRSPASQEDSLPSEPPGNFLVPYPFLDPPSFPLLTGNH